MVAAGSITVAVRVRPPTTWEAARLPELSYDTTIRGDGTLATPGRPITQSAPLRDIVQIVDDRILTFDPEERDKTRAFVERGFVPPGTKRYKDKRFMFDRVFDSGARQGDVYEATAKPLLNGLLDGYNATVFAYGATGCGKTHTISGTEGDPGIIYLTMADLFQRIDDRKDDWNIEVVATFLEIYNEEIRDLLSEPGMPTPRGGLQIREDKSVKVVGLVELHPTSAEEVKQIVLQGNSRRTQSPTHANETSSRSHAVLQVHVTQAPRTASLTEQRTMATLSIIDLAGTIWDSAWLKVLTSTSHFSRLATALTRSVRAGGAIRHVPYRNSKLTRLLKFSLGGNCKTVMVVCVAPTSQHFDDTHNTLLYAERATKIKTKVVTRNVVNVDRHVGQYVEAINRLNLEVAELKAKLSGKLGTESDILKRKRAEAAAEVDRSKRDMQDKMEQTQASIVEGASCAGKISVAEMKLSIIRSRLAQIDVLASSSPPLSSDLEAERALLKSLARLEESIITPDSPLVTRLTRSQNSRNMFEATLRAVSERRSDKIEELHVDCIKTDARCRKAEIERVRAERERDAVRDSVRTQSEMMISLLGMVGRCTVVLGETARSLEAQHGFEGMASVLRGVVQKNDDAFAALVGQTTAAYVVHGTGTLDTFRVPSGSALPQAVKASRKSMSYNAIASPPRRAYKSPRRSLRSSIGQPYRRVSDKEKEKKVVQWKDEAGQGALDDRGSAPSPPVILVTSSDSSESVNGRCHSVAGSESEWEDERTEDSLNLSNVMLPASSSSSFNSMTLHSSTSKRPRASRLDPSFLKVKGASSLGCLQEADEDSPMRRALPLSNRTMNSQDIESLHIPKYKDRDASPTRRLPTSTSRTTTQSKSSRRRSNIGPMRSEKARRRSSMILQPSEDAPLHESTNGPRRVETIGRSPAKRPKRLSLLANASRSLRVKGLNVMATLPVPTSDTSANISADLSILPDSSMRVSSKPTWR
ncbi:P-loop containing nucleoside triphosphate hydrolase protein [Suillus variegatus]|nr:P-loop containing nucleoside triphosphate hydrolase protein [Suillus variegatus]